MSFIAGYILGLEEGGGGAVEKYDRIAGLPTVFAFDMADGWRCELCTDSNPTDCPKAFGIRYDSWSEEFQSTVVYSKITKAYYLRIFCGDALMLITDMFSSAIIDNYSEWYSSNGSDVGDLMKTVSQTVGDFGIQSVQQGYNTKALQPPSVYVRYTLTQTINGTTETYDGNYAVIGSNNIKFISKSDVDINVYADFVKAVRKFSDVFNNTSAT